MSRNAGKLKPYAFSFAVSNSWSRQWNAFERSVSKAPKTLPLSTDLFHVSNITRKQCWVLHPFRKPHCWFKKMLSKKANIHFSKTFGNLGRILTGLKFSFKNLKILIEMGRIENKPSKNKSSCFLSDNNITDSEPHIPTIMATQLVETSSFNDILSASVKDQINSFVLSDTENDNNISLETLAVIRNAYKSAKYKKLRMSYYPR